MAQAGELVGVALDLAPPFAVRHQARYGLATLYIGGGQGVAMIVER